MHTHQFASCTAFFETIQTVKIIKTVIISLHTLKREVFRQDVYKRQDRKIGNNPLIMSIPRSSGRHAVIDSAVSQFSYGKIEEARLKGRQLSVPGGYDREGNLTTAPAKIEETWSCLLYTSRCV